MDLAAAQRLALLARAQPEDGLDVDPQHLVGDQRAELGRGRVLGAGDQALEVPERLDVGDDVLALDPGFGTDVEDGVLRRREDRPPLEDVVFHLLAADHVGDQGRGRDHHDGGAVLLGAALEVVGALHRGAARLVAHDHGRVAGQVLLEIGLEQPGNGVGPAALLEGHHDGDRLARVIDRLGDRGHKIRTGREGYSRQYAEYSSMS